MLAVSWQLISLLQLWARSRASVVVITADRTGVFLFVKITSLHSVSLHYLTSLTCLLKLHPHMTHNPPPSRLQYLYDEEEEVRKKKPRRKLPSNAAITRVRKHLACLISVCLVKQFASDLPCVVVCHFTHPLLLLLLFLTSSSLHHSLLLFFYKPIFSITFLTCVI